MQCNSSPVGLLLLSERFVEIEMRSEKKKKPFYFECNEKSVISFTHFVVSRELYDVVARDREWYLFIFIFILYIFVEQDISGQQDVETGEIALLIPPIQFA